MLKEGGFLWVLFCLSLLLCFALVASWIAGACFGFRFLKKSVLLRALEQGTVRSLKKRQLISYGIV